MNYFTLAKKLHQARKTAKPIPQLTKSVSGLSLKEAYLIQRGVVELALGEGDVVSGYKMGLTSKAKQRDVQVFDTIRGVLLRSFEIHEGGKVSVQDRIHPRVEPEIAMILKEDIVGGELSRERMIHALVGVYPALEIVDSRYENFKFSLPDVIADNTSASGYMIGKRNLLDLLREINLLGVVVRKNGQIVETGAPAAVLGDPFLSFESLIRQLHAEGTVLKAGMVVLTGGITNSVPISRGDLLEIEWPGEALSFNAL